MIFKDTSRITRAIEFVSLRQPAATSEQQLFHVLEVARLLSDATDGSDEDLVIAGLLHHMLDTSMATCEEIAQHFNASIASLVAETTQLKATLSCASEPEGCNGLAYSQRAKMILAADIATSGGEGSLAYQTLLDQLLRNDSAQTDSSVSRYLDGARSVIGRHLHRILKPKGQLHAI
jgi:hypothetical protein